MYSGTTAMKFKISGRRRTNFNQAEFIIDYFDKNSSNILNLKQSNGKISINFVKNMSDLLDKYALFKKSMNVS